MSTKADFIRGFISIIPINKNMNYNTWIYLGFLFTYSPMSDVFFPGEGKSGAFIFNGLFGFFPLVGFIKWEKISVFARRKLNLVARSFS